MQKDEFLHLQDANDIRVLNYIHSENQYYERVMAPLKPLVNTVANELKLATECDAPPQVRLQRLHDREYWMHEGVYYCKFEGRLELLFDSNQLSVGKSASNFAVSNDHTVLAYIESEDGVEFGDLHFRSLNNPTSPLNV